MQEKTDESEVKMTRRNAEDDTERANNRPCRRWVKAIVIASILCGVAAAVGLSAPPNVRVALVTAKPGGFQPPQITVDNGLVLLVIHNRSGVSPLTVALTDSKGVVHVSHRLGRDTKLDSFDEVVLPADTYTFSAAERPGWSAVGH